MRQLEVGSPGEVATTTRFDDQVDAGCEGAPLVRGQTSREACCVGPSGLTGPLCTLSALPCREAVCQSSRLLTMGVFEPENWLRFRCVIMFDMAAPHRAS